MTTAITVAGPAGLASAANEDVKAGLAKYMKRKRLDSIDTYIPPLLEARDQLIRIERIMSEEISCSYCFAAAKLIPSKTPSIDDYVNYFLSIVQSKTPKQRETCFDRVRSRA